jgi:hypothetical protein
MAREQLSSIREKFILGVDGEAWELGRFKGVVVACFSTMDDMEVYYVRVGVHLPVPASMSANADKSRTGDDFLNSVFQDRLKTFNDDCAWGEHSVNSTGHKK